MLQQNLFSTKYVAYFRVSTKEQERSGLGLEAQRNTVLNYIGDRGELIAEFTEIESGTRRKNRVEIYRALEMVKRENAVLIVGKLDRLARDVEFTSALFNGGVEFICCDNPNANKLTIQILSVIAEDEAERISRRIREALQVKKEKIARGNYVNKDGSIMKPDKKGKVRLGNPAGWRSNNRNKGVDTIKENAKNDKANLQALDIITQLREKEWSYKAIAKRLNELHYLTRYGKAWTFAHVRQLAQKIPKIS